MIHRITKLPLLTLVILGFITVLTWQCNEPPEEEYVVMLSMDGFRWDYPNMFDTPNLNRIAKNGVKAKSLKPSFPTKTFPNHYTMVTGLYPDHHGIVQNSFYDPDMDAYYKVRDRDAVRNGEFYGGEPIWNTAEKQGVRSASYFWVASEADIQGMRPSYYKEYEHSFPFGHRIDSVISWLKLPSKIRPRLILWYMDEPDSKGHYTGPGNPELGATISTLDSLVGVFLDEVEELPFADRINIIVTSDHGMGPTSNNRVAYLDDYIQEDWFEVIDGYNPNYLFKAKEEYYQQAYDSLRSIEHVAIWKSGDVPERLHYGTNPRTLDFILVADSSWSIGWRKDNGKFDGGAHGYDNANTDMHAIFYATGPAFKGSYIHPTFENTNIYSLICNILDLEPADTDGDIENVAGMLKQR